MIVIKETKKGIGVNVKKGTTYEEIMVGAVTLLKNIIDHSNYNVETLLEDVKGALEKNDWNRY